MNTQNKIPDNVVGNSASVIASGQSYMKRDHIQNLLKEAMQNPVITIVAGAGYGKTRTVYAFLQEYNAKTIWQQLTALDNIGARFWENFVHVVSLSDQKLASDLELLGFPETAAKFDIFLSHLTRSMTPGKKYGLVYDDFHLIHNKKVLRFMEKLINTYIHNFSVILISRSEPKINTAGLLAKGLLSVITEEDLRFSKSEMFSYYEMQNIHISRRLLSRIYADTDGWIMAIRLVELFIKRGVTREEYALTAMKQNVYKLMESDVFSLVPKRAQRFLLKLSLFDTLPLELVEALSSGNERLITEILKIHSFIRYDSFSNIYCIHHIFLDFLKQKQDILTHKEKVECYRKAADWYASNGYRIDAIDYYGKIGEYEEIIRMAFVFPHASQEEAALILDILCRDPGKAYLQEPALALLHARALWYFGKRGESVEEMELLIKQQEALPKTRENLINLCKLYFHTGVASYYLSSIEENDFSFSDYFVRASRCALEDGPVLKGRYIQDVGAYVCRISSEKKEDMDKYITAVKEAAFYAPKVARGYMYGLDNLVQAELAYFKGEIKDSGSLSCQAVHKAREGQQYVIEIRALFIFMRNTLATGDYIKTQDLLKQLDEQLKTEQLPNIQTLYDIVTGWFFSVIRQGGRVADWIKRDFDHGDLSFVASGVENLAKIKYCLSEKKYNDFLSFWGDQKHEDNMMGTNAFLFGKIAIMASKAVCLYHTNKKGEAIKTLWEAYRLSEPNSLIMQFAELGNDMVTLAKYALKCEDCAIPGDWLQNIIRKSSTYAKRLSHIASEYKRANNQESGLVLDLTKKELKLLNDVCHGMSTAEIALEHGLSPNYLNNRMQIIYSKLGAANKIDAIRIATAMKLLH